MADGRQGPLSEVTHRKFKTTWSSTMKFHPFANVFPLMSEGELKELAADIEAHGQLEPIYTYEDQILDGRNRFKACRMAKRKPWFEPWEGGAAAGEAGAQGPGGDPVAFVVSMNLRRRHLDESQRAIVAGKLAALKQGRKPLRSGADPAQVVTSKASPNMPIGMFDREVAADMTISQAAELLNVGRRSVLRAREVLEHGAESLVAAVEAGQVSVADAAHVAQKAKPIQQAALDAVRSGKGTVLPVFSWRARNKSPCGFERHTDAPRVAAVFFSKLGLTVFPPSRLPLMLTAFMPLPDALTRPLLRLAIAGPWAGSASDLLYAVETIVGRGGVRHGGWTGWVRNHARYLIQSCSSCHPVFASFRDHVRL